MVGLRGGRHLHRRPSGARVPRRGARGPLPGRGVLRGLGRTGTTNWSARSCTAHEPTPTRCAGWTLRANAGHGEDSARARRFGAQGIGLCRTEHMFLGKTPPAWSEGPGAGRTVTRAGPGALAALERAAEGGLHRHPSAAMEGLPVTVRLIDPPLARVPARLHRAVGEDRPRRGRARRRRTAGCWLALQAPATRRTPCWACAGVPARPDSIPGVLRHAWSGRSPRRPRPCRAAVPSIMIPLCGRGCRSWRTSGTRRGRVLAEAGARVRADRHTDVEVPRAHAL
ncbi:putative PEP-binding protein [Streptosporangium longisporum]|uniref:putative PEP-binding protein n=1 Tax=Streptosporangium longisporum TaxID=46187 RepID=UPI0031E8FEB9